MKRIGTGTVLLSTDGHRSDVILDRPEKRNAMTMDVIADLTTAIEEVESDGECWSIALLGNGPVFCAGMDLEMMAKGGREAHHERSEAFHNLLDTIGQTTKPTVVSIKGAAIAGGFELTLPADFRIIEADAKYGVQEVKLGIFPSGGSTQRLPRLVGLAKAKEIILSGELINPEDAERYNLVTEAVSSGEADTRTRELADELSQNAPLGMQQALKALTHTFDVPLEDGLEIERYLANQLYDTHDKDEGFQARLEGREARFKGR